MSKRKTTKEFIEDARKIHGNKYDYSKVEYINSETRVCIICPKHGEFWQQPNNHLSGKGCKKCRNYELREGRSLSKNDFINRAKQIHGDKYDYSKVEYVNQHTKVCIICPIHGEFLQFPQTHLRGSGCNKCKGKKISTSKRSNTDEFITKTMKIHGNKYDYSKVEYVNDRTLVRIICPIHGEFLQTPNIHFQGCGCQKCNESHLEKCVSKVLEDNKIEYVYQKKFDWLGKQSLDFYLPEYNIAIECQGIQHYKPVKHFGGEENFIKTLNRDKIKLLKVLENNIKMVYVNDNNKNNFLKEIL